MCFSLAKKTGYIWTECPVEIILFFGSEKLKKCTNDFSNYANFKGYRAIWHGLSGIRHIKVNYGRQSTILNLIQLKIFKAYPYLKPHILFCSNSLAIWHGLSDIRHIEINYGRDSAIFNMIKFKFLRAYP